MQISILSDTHSELPETLIEQLSQSDLIIHAGDFQTPAILSRLEAIAPVAAVRGNCDTGVLASLPETIHIERENTRFLVIHNLNNLVQSSIPEDTDIVVCGHTHVPAHTEHRGITWLNPGSPVSPRGGSSPGFIQMHLEAGKRTIQRVDI